MSSIDHAHQPEAQSVRLPLLRLSTLQAEQVQQFSSRFRELSRLFEWNNQTGLVFLHAACDPSLWVDFSHKNTQDTALDAILSATCPRQKQYEYLEELNSKKQDGSELIAEYDSRILAAATKWALSTKTAKMIVDFEIEENFMQGLNTTTRLEMSRLRLDSREAFL